MKYGNWFDQTKFSSQEGPMGDENIYVDINCECEQEHGLQLVFRKGKQITRVRQIDRHLTDADAYSKPDREDELLTDVTQRLC